MKSEYYLNDCPLCGKNVRRDNIPPFFGGIECQNPNCGAIVQFPTNLNTDDMVLRYNTRPKHIVPVLQEFAMYASIAVSVIVGLFFSHQWIINDLSSIILTSLKLH